MTDESLPSRCEDLDGAGLGVKSYLTTCRRSALVIGGGGKSALHQRAPIHRPRRMVIPRRIHRSHVVFDAAPNVRCRFVGRALTS